MENMFNINKPIKDTKVVVAMSGGVDSSVVATMLHRSGYQVVGITLQLYDQGVALMKKGACCAGQDIYDASKVASDEGFPHYVLDYESLFKQQVIDDFADSYLRGETPVPCIKCNQKVKFNDLYKFAKDLGADALATGHYVRKIYEDNVPQLHKAADLSKDQSYFLFTTTKEQLDYIYFPLGEFTKEKTRQLALEYGLVVSNKPDSQDICFVPDGDYAKIIAALRPNALEKGNIVHFETNKVIGEHGGTINFTIGQRKGLGIAWEEPLYVIKIDAKTREVFVGSEKLLGRTDFYIKEVNFLCDRHIDDSGMEVTVKTRSTHFGAEATLFPSIDGKIRVQMFIPQRAITPGQACVFYDESRVMGGGWIANSDLSVNAKF